MMRIKVYVVDFDPPRWAKKLGAYVILPAAIIGGASAVVWADVQPLPQFVATTKLKADDLNTNFETLRVAINDVDGRLAALETAPSVPTGTIVAYGKGTAPSGWVNCDGQQYNGLAAEYAALYAVIGTSFGGNTVSQAFNVPDLQGRFLRGVDPTAINDPDAASRTASNSGGHTGPQVGTLEADAFTAHNHGLYYSPNGPYGGAGTGDTLVSCAGGNGNYLQTAGGAETRPKNVAVNYIIKL